MLCGLAVFGGGCATAGDGGNVYSRERDGRSPDAELTDDAGIEASGDAARELDAHVDAAVLESCSDGIRNRDETGIDCGGTQCPACTFCDRCDGEGQCVDGLSCRGGRCVREQSVAVDWRENCVQTDEPDYTLGIDVLGMPAGRLQITAVSGGGSSWSVSVHDPPTRGYIYRINCEGFDASALASTPAGVYYATPEEAFAAVESKSIEVQYAGGEIKCYVEDGSCTDNTGQVEFTIQSVCDAV